jgi:four helix bundle protein
VSEPIKSYRDLIAWQKAYAVGMTVYQVAGRLPEAERFGLMAAMRRVSTTIASNIAQGYGRGNQGDYLWFLKIARGEIYQLDTQLLFAVGFKYLPDDEYQKVKRELDEAERVLAGLIKSLGG